MTIDRTSDATSLPSPTPAPEMIGPYRILGVLGEGGMGTVYEAAETGPVRRRVALKIIRAGLDSREVLARFDLERQALALMDHEHREGVRRRRDRARRAVLRDGAGARAPDHRVLRRGGSTPGSGWSCSSPSARPSSTRTRRGSSTATSSRRTCSSRCRTASPVPKVIDFGIAKATERAAHRPTLFTELGADGRHAEYMSPEQAEIVAGWTWTRGRDVYSLGVMLYELLGGRAADGAARRSDSHLHGSAGLARGRSADAEQPAHHARHRSRRCRLRATHRSRSRCGDSCAATSTGSSSRRSIPTGRDATRARRRWPPTSRATSPTSPSPRAHRARSIGFASSSCGIASRCRSARWPWSPSRRARRSPWRGWCARAAPSSWRNRRRRRRAASPTFSSSSSRRSPARAPANQLTARQLLDRGAQKRVARARESTAPAGPDPPYRR